MFATTAPLRQALAEAFAQRPFAVAFWDGTRVEATTPDAPTFTLRSPEALGARRPQPRRAGDRPRVRRRADRRRRPGRRVGGRHRVGRSFAGRRDTGAPGRRRPPRGRAGQAAVDPVDRAASAGPAALDAARSQRDHVPLRRGQRLLQALPGPEDGLQLCDLLARRHDARGGAAHEARPRRREARPAAGRPVARRRLWLGCLRHTRRARVRREGRRHHARQGAGGARARAGPRGRDGGPGRDPSGRLP